MSLCAKCIYLYLTQHSEILALSYEEDAIKKRLLWRPSILVSSGIITTCQVTLLWYYMNYPIAMSHQIGDYILKKHINISTKQQINWFSYHFLHVREKTFYICYSDQVHSCHAILWKTSALITALDHFQLTFCVWNTTEEQNVLSH